MEIRLEDYDYELPPERIAQEPPPERGDSRLLVLDREKPELAIASFREIGRFLRPDDLLVLNDTRVFPARLRGRRASGGAVEVFLLRTDPRDGRRWEAFVSPAKGARTREEIRIEGVPGAAARAGAEVSPGIFSVQLTRDGRPLQERESIELCEAAGEVPLPPYIRRSPGDPRLAVDRARYQTVFAREAGAVAAPTAGLHFTTEHLEELRAQGIETVSVTLHVGLGTFKPLEEEMLRSGRLHRERFRVSGEAGRRILEAQRSGRRIVAVGTTAARTLESWVPSLQSGELDRAPLGEADPAGREGGGAVAAEAGPWSGETEILIAPGHPFRAVGALLTNFHLPRSSLLLLVSALAGRERILEAYRRAIAEGFRFYSYGDAMLIL